MQDDMPNTNYTYYPFDERLYSISIRAFYQLLLGDIATTMANYQKGKCNAKLLKLKKLIEALPLQLDSIFQQNPSWLFEFKSLVRLLEV